MKIYTKTGDQGDTGLFGGGRKPKSDLQIDAYGSLDETNAWLGLLRDCITADYMQEEIIAIQTELFAIGSVLATAPGKPAPVRLPSADDMKILEDSIDKMEAELQPLKNFLLPGGHPIVSYCHLARTVCRRAERAVVALHQVQPVDESILQYLNRLSDYLFVLSRLLAVDLEAEEIAWVPNKK